MKRACRLVRKVWQVWEALKEGTGNKERETGNGILPEILIGLEGNR
jgi:hypothetical protein